MNMRMTSFAFLLSFFVMGSGEAFAQASGRENPFSRSWDKEPFRIPPFGQIEDGDYLPALEEAIRFQNQAIEEIAGNREEATFENTILALENSGERIEKVAGVLFNVAAAHSNDSLRQIEAQALQLLSSQNDNVYMNPFLFRRVKRLKEQEPRLDPVRKKLLEDVYLEFVRNGALLDAKDQEALRAVNLQLSELENKFSRNLLLATAQYELLVEDRSRLEGLPEDDLRRAALKAEAAGKKGYLFGLDNPTLMPFLQYVKDAGLRKEILDAYLSRCQAGSEYDNTQVVQQILALRLQKARLLGFPDYASYALQTRMAGNPEAVYDLLGQIWPSALARAKEELAEMKRYRKEKEGYRGRFLPSDWRYYANLVKKEKYDLDENALKEYFSLEAVKNGIFYLCDRLYGISFEKIDSAQVPTPDTEAYLCKDEDGSPLGVLFLDMVARPGQKSGGAWNTTYVEQAYDLGGNRLMPVTSIVCNYTPPVENRPTLLSIDETQTFFHEFGHALHALFSKVKYKGLSEVPRDFVELPSQIMEHWALHPLMLQQYARHYRTGEALPEELAAKIQDVLRYGQGFAMTELLAAALLDMDCHTLQEADADFDPEKFESRTLGSRGLIPEIYPRYRTNYFAHSMGGGYSAGYYSYIWSEVLDADAFSAFEQSGDIFNRQVARSFREDILQNGGMYPAMDMYVKFRGHEPAVEALLSGRGLD